MPRSLIGLTTALALSCGLAQAQLYKWTDANGRTQYSDKPPVDAKSVTEVKRQTASSASTAAASSGATKGSATGSSIADQEQAFRKRQMERQEAAQKLAKADDEKRRMTEQCQRARQYLAGLEAGGRQARIDSKGERYYLDDAQVEREKASARADVSAVCK